MRTILIISGVVSLAVLLLVIARQEDPSIVADTADNTKFELGKPVANSSIHPSAHSEVALEQNKQPRSTRRPVRRDPPAKLPMKRSQETLNTELLDQVRALRAEVAELRRSKIGVVPNPPRKTLETPPVLDPETATDHNPYIPGIQQEDEPLGRPVNGDWQNTIHPGTPKEVIAEDEALKTESQKLTGAAEAKLNPRDPVKTQ